MSIEVLHVGDLFEVEATFRNAAGALVDPTTVALDVLPPSGVAVTYVYPTDVQKESTGVYYYEIDITAAGEWRYFWSSTGTGRGGEPGQFVVEGVPFA